MIKARSPLDPLRFFELVGRLKKIPRTGWLIHGLSNVESIAEHSFRTTIIAYMLSKDLGCDGSKLIRMALVHDLSEIMTGDIVSEHGSAVDLLKRDKKIMDEDLALQKLSSITPLGDDMYLLWKEYSEQKTREARILKEIDKLEMAFQALDYENPRNPNHLREFWENAKTHIKHPLLLSIFKRLCEKRTPPYNCYEMIGRV